MQPLPPPETDEQRKARQLATLHAQTDTAHDPRPRRRHHGRRRAPGPRPRIRSAPSSRARARRDYHAIFNRYATTVRQSIALEAKIAADGFARPARSEPPPHRPPGRRPHQQRRRPNAAARIAIATDPRRQLLRRALENSVVDREIRRLIHDRIDGDLHADPEAALSPATLLVDICRDFNLKIDFARLPDEILDALADGVDADPPPSPQTGPPERA